VTIDGDTSTSDTLMMFATGKAGNPRIARASDPRLKAFKIALQKVLANLAPTDSARRRRRAQAGGDRCRRRGIEGIGAAHRHVDRQFAAGKDCDCRRGRQLGPRGDAVGKAGEPADRDKLSIWFGGIRVAHKGARDPGYDEAAVSTEMKKPEIFLKVALGLGKGRDRVLNLRP